MKRLFASLFLVSFLLPISGCGEPTYDIPPIDQEESKKQGEDMKAKMEAEYRAKMGGGGAKKK